MTLPRVLTLHKDGRLRYDVAKEVLSLRGTHRQGGFFSVDAFHPLDVQSDSLEIGVIFLRDTASRVGIALRRAPDGAEETRIIYDYRSTEVSIERQQSSLDMDTQRETHHAPQALSADEALTMHIFIDCSIVEVFVNDRLCLTTRIYPTRADSQGVALLAEGGTALVEQVDTWEMR
jgi:beta-fructofuranosidase